MPSFRSIVCLGVVCLVAAGCAPKNDKEGDGRASSLVYSPAARLPTDAERDSSGNAGASAVVDEVRPPAGRRCRVHLRREAMGVAGQAPYPMSGNNLAADRVLIAGTLERVGRDWLVLRGERSTYYLPRDVVLAVEFVDER